MNSKEFIKAVKFITEEKGISEDVIFEGMEQALITAYKKNFKKQTNVKVDIDRKTGDIKVFKYFVVVDEYHEGEEYIDEEGNVLRGSIGTCVTTKMGLFSALRESKASSASAET